MGSLGIPTRRTLPYLACLGPYSSLVVLIWLGLGAWPLAQSGLVLHGLPLKLAIEVPSEQEGIRLNHPPQPVQRAPPSQASEGVHATPIRTEPRPTPQVAARSRMPRNCKSLGYPWGIWPEIRSDGIVPYLIDMYHGGPCHLLEVSDAHFGLSLLVVSVDAREGKAFPFCVAVADPVVRGEGAIFGMIIPYPYPSFP